MATDAHGTWIAAWESATDDCPLGPAGGCRGAERTRVVVGDQAVGDRDKLQWKWTRGKATTVSDLGDPTATTDYVLCLYDDDAGSPRLVLEQDTAAGALCLGEPCWTAASAGFLYRDRRNEQGAVKLLDLQAGDAGRAKIRLRAGGPTLRPPALPLSQDPRVTVQLVNLESSLCWEATYTTAVQNDGWRFKARTP